LTHGKAGAGVRIASYNTAYTVGHQNQTNIICYNVYKPEPQEEQVALPASALFPATHETQPEAAARALGADPSGHCAQAARPVVEFE